MNLQRVVLLAVVSLSCAVLAAPPLQSCTDAQWVAHAGALEATLTNMTCVQVATDSVPDSNMRVVKNGLDPTADADAWAALILSSAKTAFTKYRQLNAGVGFQNVTFALTPHDEPTVHALASTDLEINNECLVVIRTQSPSVVSAEGRAKIVPETVAHELVHCLQRWNVGDQMKVDKQYRDWWSEGSAEYLGNVVFPTASETAYDTGLFADHDDDVTLLNYGMLVFFAWYGKSDPGAVFSFWQQMPTTAGRDAQHAALISAATESGLQAFAQAWAEGSISMPDGTVLKQEQIEQLTFLHPESKTVTAKAFSVLRRALVFQGGEYALAITQSAMPEGQFKTSSGWGGPPQKGGSWCGGDGDHVLLAGMSLSGDQTVSVSATQTEKPASPDCSNVCMPKEQTDPCLVGEWLLDDVAVEKRVDEIFDGKTNPHAVVNGTTTLTLGKDGTNASIAYDDYDIFVGAQGQNGNPDVFYDFTITGAIKGAWSTGADHSFQICATENTSSILTEVQIFDGDTNPKSSTVDKGDALANLAYSCVGSSLELKAVGIANEKGSPVVWVFHRKAGTGVVGANACSMTPESLLAMTVLGFLLRSRRRSHHVAGRWTRQSPS